MALDNFVCCAQPEGESFVGFLGDFSLGIRTIGKAGLGDSDPIWKEPEPDKTHEREANIRY